MTTAPKPGTQGWDVVVVGAGAAGCAVAARLSEDPGRRVLLLEAGPVPANGSAFPAELLDPTRLVGAEPGHPHNWALPARLTAERRYSVARGRILGGSTTINGGYFVRARPVDFDAWQAAGGDAWSRAAAVRLYERLERDLDFGTEPGHGDHGPMPVSRVPDDRLHPVSAGVLAAATQLGMPVEADKNGDEPAGAGRLPRNVRDGVRCNAALAYLAPAIDRPNLEVRGATQALRVRFDGERAIGVEVQDAGGVSTVFGDEIVLSAGAMLSPRILLHSGIGPADDLHAAGIALVTDAQVGRGFSDHPSVTLAWRASRTLPAAASAYEAALNWSSSAAGEADLELLAAAVPDSHLFGPAHDDRYSTHVVLQRADSRGMMRVRSGDPLQPLDVRYGYLETSADRVRLRAGMRLAADLLAHPALGDLVGERVDLDARTLRDDAALDAWIRAHLGTAIHACGSCRMGTDAGAVVDGTGRVHGVTGLRVADTSILPTAPHRGPAATAVLVGELIAAAATST